MRYSDAMPERPDFSPPPSRRSVLGGFGALVAAIACGSLPARAATYEVTHTDAQWRALLTPAQYTVLRQGGTEFAFSSPLDKEFRPGTYHVCGLPFGAVRLEHEVRQRHGLAELFPSAPGCRLDRGRPLGHDGAGRSTLPPLRQSSRARLRRRAEADGLAILHERRRADLRAARLTPRRKRSHPPPSRSPDL